MTWPGMKGGEYQTNGLEHDEAGTPELDAHRARDG